MLSFLYTLENSQALHLQLRRYLRAPISLDSVAFAIRALGERPATLLYKDLVELFLAKRPLLPIDHVEARDFRRTLAGTGFPQAIFRKLRTSPDPILQLKVNYWLDRAIDTCAELGSTEHALDKNLIPVFLAFFGLHEQIFWVIAGASKLEAIDGGEIFEFRSKTESAAFFRWYSGFLTQKSEEALLLKMLQLVGITPHGFLKNQGLVLRISDEILEKLSFLILDTCFSLNHRFIDTLSEHINFAKAKNSIKWISLLILWREIYGEEFLFFSNSVFCGIDLSREDANRLKALGAMIIEFNDEQTGVRLKRSFSVSYLSSEIRQFVIPELSMPSVGEWFEKEYLPKYISMDAMGENYKVYPGIKSSQGDQVIGYDVDLIVEDLRRRKFYFAQVKYQQKSYFPYLNDEFEGIFIKKDGIRKGIDQLSALRGNLHDFVVSQKIASALGKKLNEETLAKDCHFVILHNLNGYDIAEIDGIPAYNWNLFRNFLRGGISAKEVTSSNSVSYGLHYGSALPLESATATVKRIATAISGHIGDPMGYLVGWHAHKAMNITLAHPDDIQKRVIFGLC